VSLPETAPVGRPTSQLSISSTRRPPTGQLSICRRRPPTGQLSISSTRRPL